MKEIQLIKSKSTTIRPKQFLEVDLNQFYCSGHVHVRWVIHFTFRYPENTKLQICKAIEIK